MTASINYLHREKFRSDVVVTFHAPIVLTSQQDKKLFSSNPEEKNEAIRKLTALLENTVRSTLLDAQDWQTVRIGHTARRLYGGDLGTRISLGQYVRLTRKFVSAFGQHKQETAEAGVTHAKNGETLKVRGDEGLQSTEADSLDMKQPVKMDAEVAQKIDKLAEALAVSRSVDELIEHWKSVGVLSQPTYHLSLRPDVIYIGLPRSIGLFPPEGLSH
jgi:glycerol-3-phosphate O-acyltransferase/dihydroxyacetone phosphate acyltransferase